MNCASEGWLLQLCHRDRYALCKQCSTPEIPQCSFLGMGVDAPVVVPRLAPMVQTVQLLVVDVPVNSSDKFQQHTSVLCKLYRKPSRFHRCSPPCQLSENSSDSFINLEAIAVAGFFFGRFYGLFRTPSGWMLSARLAATLFKPSMANSCWPFNNNTIWGGSVLTGEELPPHSGKLTRALSQVGVSTESQASRPVSSGHHISMEHRQRRKHLLLNPDTNA